MARTWLQIKVDLLAGRGARCTPSPGRIFIVGPGHSFPQFADAINAAFARWDLSHLHNFELAGERLIGYPDDSFGPDMVWLDHTKLKVSREVKAGDEFEYVFDLGDNWQHRCTVLADKADPVDDYGSVPAGPVAIWGWGSIPDQYGRRWLDDDGEDEK
jgi:Plasmid pRiA4b ORF-3-like protein